MFSGGQEIQKGGENSSLTPSVYLLEGSVQCLISNKPQQMPKKKSVLGVMTAGAGGESSHLKHMQDAEKENEAGKAKL